jgi:hypothetical protein
MRCGMWVETSTCLSRSLSKADATFELTTSSCGDGDSNKQQHTAVQDRSIFGPFGVLGSSIQAHGQG